MIVVRKEDRPKYIVLGALLVLFLGLAVTRVLGALSSGNAPASEPTQPAPAPAPVPPAGAPVATVPTGPVVMNYSELPSPTEGNPFRTVLPVPGAPSAAPAPTKAGQVKSGVPMPRPLVEGGGSFLTPMPVGPSGGSSAVSVVPKTITLNGIVSGRTLSALVSVGDETETVTVGRGIEGFLLVELSPRSAVFATRTKRITLTVGESASAPIG